MNQENYQAQDKDKEVINNPIGAGLEVGFRRPRFYRDAPRWFTAIIFAAFIAVIAWAIFARR